jgi:hypothetical protein
MLTIDAQVHAYERNHPGRPWHAELTGPREVTGDQMVAAMDAVGVDSAILVSPFTIYRYDASYALEVHERHSARFALVKPVDPANPSVAEVIADWKRTPGAVGVRMLLARGGYTEDPADPGLNRVLAEGTFVAPGQPAHCRAARPRARADPPQSRYADHSRSSALFSRTNRRCQWTRGPNCRRC